MKKIETIEEIHNILLDIAKAFHEVCVKNNIPYYIAYGTQLGATRHQGFIPWDDDMDVAVRWEYYDKLEKALKKDLPPHYRVLTRYDKTGAVGGYIKIEDTQTIITEKAKLHDNENSGVFLDVFALYPSDGNSKLLSRYSIVKFLSLIQAYRFFDKSYSSKIKKMIGTTIKIFFWGLKKPMIPNFIENHILPKQGNYVSVYPTIYHKKDIVPSSFYGKPKLYKFEDTEFYGVEEDEKYLTYIYGEYMILPPKEKRRIHMADAFYK